MNQTIIKRCFIWILSMMSLLCVWTTPLNAQEETSANIASTNTPYQDTSKDARLGTIVITATRTPHALKDVPVETVVVDRNDINRMNAQNGMDVIQGIPGINIDAHDDVLGTYTWRANLRGLNFNDGYGLILVDGQRLMGCGQSGGMGEYGVGLNQIPVNMIERVEVVKGPSSALYGSDAMAGVINIITKKSPEKSTTKAGVAYGWYNVKERTTSSGDTEKASDDGKYRGMSQAYVSHGGRISDRLGYLLHYNYESAEDTGKDPIDADRHSFMGKVDLSVTEEIDLSMKSELSSYDKEHSQEEDSYRYSASMDYRPNGNHFFALKGYTYNWDFIHGYPGYSYGYKHGDVSYNQGEAQYTWYATEHNTLTVGGEFQKQDIDFLMENADGSAIRVDEEVDTFSFYGQDEITIFETLTLVGGLRYDDHSVFGDEVNPKLSAMTKLSEDTIVRASVGKAFKSPTIRQLYYSAPYRHGDFYVQSNPDLKPETGIGYSASVEQWLFDNSIMMNLGYFRNDVDDMVVDEDEGETYDGLPLRIYRNVEEAMTQGLEAMVRAYLTEELSASLAYTYTASENKETGKDLTYIPEHSLTFSPAYESKRLHMGTSATISYVGKQYKDSSNSSQIDEHVVASAKVYKDLAGEKTRLSLEVDNVFDSDKGDTANFRSGRTFLIKMDMLF